MNINPWYRQSLRFAVVGLASNLVLYLLYLILTNWFLGHKTAMTLLYVTGTLQTFAFNKIWTFSHTGNTARSLARYILAYGSGYVLNWLLLALMVDRCGYPHTIVQGAAILLVALWLFVLQKYWVFPAPLAASAQNKAL